MRIAERRLRRLIRSVILENVDTPVEIAEWIEDRLIEEHGFNEVSIELIKDDPEDARCSYIMVNDDFNSKCAIIYLDAEGDQDIETVGIPWDFCSEKFKELTKLK